MVLTIPSNGTNLPKNHPEKQISSRHHVMGHRLCLWLLSLQIIPAFGFSHPTAEKEQSVDMGQDDRRDRKGGGGGVPDHSGLGISGADVWSA